MKIPLFFVRMFSVDHSRSSNLCYYLNMKKRYKFSLVFVIIHLLLTAFAFYAFYDPQPNGDLGVLFFPNIFISVLVTDNLPNIFGYWSNIYYSVIFWAVIGFLIGWFLENRKAAADVKNVS